MGVEYIYVKHRKSVNPQATHTATGTQHTSTDNTDTHSEEEYSTTLPETTPFGWRSLTYCMSFALFLVIVATTEARLLLAARAGPMQLRPLPSARMGAVRGSSIAMRQRHTAATEQQGAGAEYMIMDRGQMKKAKDCLQCGKPVHHTRAQCPPVAWF